MNHKRQKHIAFLQNAYHAADMNLLVLIIVLILLFGGGLGYHLGGNYGPYWGGGSILSILVILLVLKLLGVI